MLLSRLKSFAEDASAAHADMTGRLRWCARTASAAAVHRHANTLPERKGDSPGAQRVTRHGHTIGIMIPTRPVHRA
jgi:hypothetical protein